MTNQEAIREFESLLKWASLNRYPYVSKQRVETVKMAIEALEQEPCADCINRREAIKRFTYNYEGERIPDYDCDNFPVQIAIKTVKEILRELPSVNPQPKAGHWIDKSKQSG